MMNSADSMDAPATNQMQVRCSFFERRSHPKIQIPKKVDSKKKATRPSMARGPPKILPDEAGVVGPVHAELELLDQTGHHPNRHIDQQQGPEELGEPLEGRVVVAIPTGLEQCHQEGQADGDRHEQEVVDARGGELPAGEIGGHEAKLPSLRVTARRAVVRRSVGSWSCSVGSVGRSDVALGPHLVPPQVGVAAGSGRAARRGSPARPPVLRPSTSISSTDSRPARRWVIRTSERPSVHVEQVSGERVCGSRLEVLGRLVEHQHREVGQQGPSYRQPLALATREARPMGAHLGGQTLGQIAQPGGQPHPARTPSNSVVGRVAAARLLRFSPTVVSKR